MTTIKPVINGTYLERRAWLERMLKNDDLARPGSRRRHYAFLIGIGLICLSVLGVSFLLAAQN